MSDSLQNLDSDQLDVFREIGNIGAGNAATSLSKILDRKIDLDLPDVRVVPFDAVMNILDGPETVVTGVLIDMKGDMDGFILLVLRQSDAKELISLLISEDMRSGEEFDYNEMEQSAILEISNILVGSFINAISAFTGLSIVPSAPQMTVDMLGAIMSIAAIEYGKMGDSVLFMKTDFSDEQNSISGHFFLIPDYNSYKLLLNSLGL